MKKKIRLDQLTVERGLAETRTKAQAMIMAGEILVGGQTMTKAGVSVPATATLTCKNSGPKFVSRGGIKLAGALDHFQVDPQGWNCLDVGASTGGFTDSLLQRGAKHVSTIDVGRGQLDPKIRNHPQVTWKEEFHARKLTPATLPKLVDLAVVDVSFISLKKVLPFVIPCIRPGGRLLALIKPQFEATRKDVVKGVLKDETKRQVILREIERFASEELQLTDLQLADAVITGPKGNREAFLFGTKSYA